MPAPLWTIRRESMAAFERLAYEQYVERQAARLGHDFPELKREHGDLTKQVEAGIACAKTFRIVGERDVERFLDVWCSARFDPVNRLPWARGILENPRLTANAKVSLLLQLND